MALRNARIRAMQVRRSGLYAGALARRSQLRGDPGLFGSIGKILGKVAPIAKVIPGVGNVLSAVSLGGAAIGAAKGLVKAKSALPAVGGLQTFQLPKAGLGGLGKLALGAGAVAGGIGAAGIAERMMKGERRRYRRMNPLNHKAATRAVRRIKAVRKLCRSIESSLPKQKAACRPAFGGRKR